MPLVQTTDRNLNQVQQNVAQTIRPLLENPATQGNLITSYALQPGQNVINHGLNRALQGWMIVRIDAASTVFDLQATNPTPDKTLILQASAGANVSIYCF